MLQSCTKFRVFNVLLLLCVVNVLVYRSFFHQRLFSSSLLALSSNATSSAPSGSGRGGNNSSLHPGHREVTSIAVSDASDTGRGATTVGPTTEQANSRREGSEALPLVWGPGPLLQARGKAVVSKANVTAPWLSYNTTTLCPLVPSKLVGPLATYKDAPSFEEIVNLNPGLEPGGHFHPPDCRARSRVAVVIPYRDRELHLRILVHNLHPMLMRQQLDYAIIVVELAQPTEFNRAMLMNIGAVEALGLWDFQCFIFHDVDLVPENDRNLYTCPEMPRHMSVAVDKFGYQLPYQALFGGVTALARDHFYSVNGYSNKYFGWGGEDDDMAARVNGNSLKISRYSMDVARYRMIKHNRDSKNEPNPKRFDLLRKWKDRQDKDGLSSLQYEVQRVEFRPAYTWILVSIDKDAVMKS